MTFMADSPSVYDPRYLAGIVLFNRGDFFEAHEVWEELWMETAGPDKRFYQALIQAAVSLCHFCNGNVRGAGKLYQSSRDYMSRYDSPHHGLDIARFWKDMEHCYAELLANKDPDKRLEPDEERIPTITLDPSPDDWPDPATYIHEE
jgi:predicted metal-dependent hydrolase